MSEARDDVPRVLSGKLGAASDPLGGFILAQGHAEPDAFQLPEPILGPIGEATDVLVVSLNPGYCSEEDIPRLSATLDTYIDWYANRMAAERRDQWKRPMSLFRGAPGLIRHYWAIERDYLDPALAPQSLGRRAVYADAIPWKWNSELRPDLNNTAILRYARGRIAEIASVLQPKLLVTFGVFAAAAVSIDRPQPAPVVKQRRMGYWQGRCLALFRPNRRWPTGRRAAYIDAGQQQLRDVAQSSLFKAS